IMIDEQKKMVGTVKAFGFHKSEILGKYLVFGVTAGIIGSLAGILVALGLSGIVLNAFNNTAMYHIGPVRSVITPGMTIIASLLMIGVCALATTIACTDILRSPASILMKGGTSKKKNNSNGKKTSSSRGGSLYSRLIIRNMLDDKVRVIISIIIIAFSTLLVGTGLSMKLGFDGMVKKQLSDVHHYDFKVDLGNKVTGADKAKLEATMTNDGAEFLPASYESYIFHLEDRLDMLNVLTADPEKLDEFFAVRDLKKGTPLTIPDDGVLAQKKMKESYGFGEGSTITALNTDLHECNADVRGVFQNYVGRIAITSPTGYRTVFGEDPTYNCYYVKAAGGDSEKLQKELLAVSGDISFEESSAFASTFESVTFMYNLIVIVTTAIAILMSAMILSNLANIFLNRKKTELTVMRINGFSIKQTKGYLTRETVVTTAIGILLGVIAGVIAAPLIIRALEQPDLQFVRTFHLLAWVAAIAIEGLFSLVIYSIVFRKVKDLNFRDVA
ncbi:MAG: ABC transporter permease, partial [Mogibacterium sp.]|nr:ABC transporter permease [Mogibacterium sp.]